MSTKTNNTDIFCIGSITTDLFLHADAPVESLQTEYGPQDFFMIPVGEKLQLFDTKKYCGGGAANTSIGFSKLGLKSGVISHVGHDDHYRFIEETLQNQNIDTSLVDIVLNSESSFSIIMMADDGRRTVLHERVMCPENILDLEQAQPNKGIYISHIMTEEEKLLFQIPEYKKQNPNVKIGWNPGKTQFRKGISHFKDILNDIDMLVLNVEEAEQFTGLHAQQLCPEDFEATGIQIINPSDIKLHDCICDARALAKTFFDLGLQKVIITDGKKGAQLFTPQETYYVPGGKTKPKSTLGAGDAFSVGAFSALLYEKDSKTQLLWGSKNAEATIQTFGAQSGQLTLKEIE